MDESVATSLGNTSEANPGGRTEGDADLAARLAEARERLAFYESFDTLIQENVRRSGELLRQVAAEQEQADRKMRAMQAQVDQRLAEQRATLEDLASSLAGLQTSLESIALRINDSLSGLPPVTGLAQPGTLPATSPESAPARLDDRGAEQAGQTMVLPPEEPAPVYPAMGLADAGAAAVTRGDAAPGALEMERPAMTAANQQSGSVGSAPAIVPPTTPNKIDLIVHGVPNAATALSLQRHIQGLRKVDSVEVREYVSGVLRFQIIATSFGADDLKGWPGGGGLELITNREHVLELKLPTAEGF